MIRRVFTDVPPDDLAMMANAIAADNGTFTPQTQEDGNLTLFAEYPGNPPPEQQPGPGAQQFPWMPIARDEVGVAEGQGDPRISQYFATTTLGPQPSSVPWCSAFVNFCVARGGDTGTNSALARSWLTWGQNAASLLPGCIVVLSRGSPALGHVGFYVGDDGQGSIRLLGGNQHNSVNISSFPKANILGGRIPASTAQVATPPAASANPGGGFNLDGITVQRRAMAMHIVDAFAAQGFAKVQQATALANALAESGLDPRKRNTASPEDSVGLFQLNRNGGEGAGHTVEDLMDPDRNIAIVIAAVRRINAFTTATSLQQAVDAFVTFFERPRDKPGAIAARLETAQRLMA
jgi:uncharacterized protein (TIGR02594 family)